MPQGEFRITGPGLYRQRDGGEAKVYCRDGFPGACYPWKGLGGDGEASEWKDDGHWYLSEEEPQDLIAYIGPLPDARPSPDAVDWARVRVDAAMRFHALKLAACYGDDALTSGAHVRLLRAHVLASAGRRPAMTGHPSREPDIAHTPEPDVAPHEYRSRGGHASRDIEPRESNHNHEGDEYGTGELGFGR